ncbi:MAG: T9SS type A sorting domain-containing protein [Bacteroidales bacterium]|nr:T9SS type A sorting domain-containing protein [Bacteroidales bacterium]MCF8397057.1 T9SS type A sorting domain-containing protein [Bacteroidales bacterium]
MKQIERFKIGTCIIALLMMSNGLFANYLTTDQHKQNDLKILKNTYQVLEINNEISDFELNSLYMENQEFLRISMITYTSNLEYGAPELPVNRKLIEIPFGAELSLEILAAEYVDFDLQKMGYEAPIYPAQPPQSKSQENHPFIYDRQKYMHDSYGQKDLAWTEMIGVMRGIRIARLNIAPFQYNPVQNVLRVYSSIQVRVSFDGADIASTIEMKKKNANPYFSGLNSFFLNHKTLPARENFMRYPIKYVIVSDPMFEAQLQPLVTWKTQKGFTVIEAYTDDPNVGNSKNSIKNYLENLYNQGTPEDPAPSFVLFVGDVQQIPAWEEGNGETDRPYCEYTGDDLPEIYYGRMSAQTTVHLQPQIDKTLQYEKYTMPQPAYLDTVVMVAGMDGSHGYDWANGQINYGTINYFNEDHDIYSNTYLYPNSGSQSAQIKQNISDGVTFGNYTAHCSPNGWADPSFVISDIPNLENQDQYCVLVGNCCSSSEFGQNECFSEALLRAENKGAVGYIGGSNSTYWDEDYYFGVGVGEISENPPPYEETTLGYYDRAFHDHGEAFGEWYVSLHEMIFAGNLAVTEGSPGSSNYYWDIYNTSGDPSLMVYFSNPPEINVSHEPFLPMNTGSFEVNTDPYAYVAISFNGTLHGAALADSNGYALVEITPFTSPCDAELIITKQNGKPYMGTVAVGNPEGPYLMLASTVINDSLGNDNNRADFGESIYLNVSLENIGNSDALNARASISTDDQYITLTDDFQEWGNIAAHTTAVENNAYYFSIDEVIPDQHVVTFDMQMEDDSDEVWQSEINITLNAPVLSIMNMIIDDSEFGNDNGRLDPGETADIKIRNKNTGHSVAKNTVSTLNTDCHYISMENTVDSIGELGLFGSVFSVYRVSVDPETPNGAILAEFNCTLSSEPYDEEKTFVKKIGLLYEDFETGDFTKFDWEHPGDQAWVITSQYPYEGFFSAKSGSIAHNQTSELKLRMEVMTADSISFIRKVSSEANYDFLRFYINGQLKGEWSGTNEGWKKEIFYVSTGWKTFRWVFIKDGGGSGGADCAWLDYIVFPPEMCLTVYAGADELVCQGEDFQCQGEATDFESLEWTTSGSGNFDDPTILDPVYTPSDEDLNNGEVTLTLTAYDDEGSSADDETSLTFIEEPGAPDKPQGPDVVDVAITPTSEYTTGMLPYADVYEWNISPEEAGTIEGNNTTATVNWNLDYSGQAGISVMATNDCGSGEWSEIMNVTVNNTVGLDEKYSQNAIQVYPNPFKEQTHIKLGILRESHICISLYNASGQQCRLVEPGKTLGRGNYQYEINSNDLEKGIYFLQFRSDDQIETKKIIIIK